MYKQKQSKQQWEIACSCYMTGLVSAACVEGLPYYLMPVFLLH